MSTRARTRAAVAAAAATTSSTALSTTSSSYATSSKPTSKPSSVKGKQDSAATISPIKQQQQQEQQIVVAEPYIAKENLKTVPNTTTTRSTTTKKQSSAKSKAILKANVAYCTCHRGDDGSPMIRCAECKLWYHFICVDLSEREAEEINVYICSLCTQSTGRRTAMVWEGIDTLEDCGSEEENTAVSKTTSLTNAAKQRSKKLSVTVSLPPQPRQPTPSDDSDDADSADDYIAEDEETKNFSKTKGKRRLRRISSSDSNSSSEETTTRTSRRVRLPDKLHKFSSPRSQTPVSPALVGATTPVTSTSSKSLSRLKRKASIVEKETLAPPPKRKRSDAGGGGATIDPVRKYCLGKFEDVFKEVFLRYPYTRSVAGQSGETRDVKLEGQAQISIVMKKLEELTEEEKEGLIEDSKNFAAELERCVFDNYSEGDIAGAKYKDRFRTLQFNLSKTDRIVIHQRIVMCTITPQEISRMSSTDLADEETKQNIKIAEKESLEQTILQKPTVPRAKITHKGLQDIEDVNGDLARARETEGQREREQEEEERRERERRERLRAVEKQQQKQRTLSATPESPLVSSHSPITVDQQTWGAPPPVPAHVLQQHQQQHDIVGPTDDILGSSIRPLFAHTMSDVVMATVPEEHELNLADLINIDEDSMDVSNVSTTTSVAGVGDASTLGSSGDVNATTTATDTTPSGIVLSPLEQPIEPNGSISDKPLGAHHTISGSAHLMATTPMSSRSSAVSPFSGPRPRGLSFDLNSLWQSVSKGENDNSQAPKSPPVSHQQRGPSTLLDPEKEITARAGGNDGGENGASDISSGNKRSILQGIGREEPEPMEVANDDDFDMFLAEEKDVVDRSGSHEVAAGNGGTMANSAASGKITSEAETHLSQDLETIQQCWTGKILMPLDTAAPQTTIVSAKQVGGRSLESQSLWWQTLFPSDELRIDGRVNTKSSEDFLTQTRLNQHKELVAVAFLPVSEEMKGDFIALIEYLKDRDRHGLIFPWGHRPKDTCPGREMYLVPLRAKEPLPEYIELLDELKIPGTRKMDLLIGIWILHRGRLNHPPPEPLSASTSTPTSAAPPTILTPAAPTVPVPLMPNIPSLPPHLASAKSQSPSVPMPSQNLPPSIHSGAPSQPPPGLLAQFAPTMTPEVAPLTHDQVQNLLRSLSTNLSFPINLPIPSNNGPSAAAPPPPMLGQSHRPPSLPSQPWPGFPVPSGPPPSQPSGSYPPPGAIYGQPSHSHSFSPPPPPPPPPPPHHGTSNNDRRDSYGPSPNFYGGGRNGDRERGERSGWRGGRDRHQRGRGKHRGGGGANATPRPVDSGWPRRPRHDDENGSPSRRWG